MNKVILVGRSTKDVEVRYGGANNTAMARMTLAVDRRFKKEGAEQTADFIGCVAFGKTAEFLGKYGKKGTKFVIEGRIQTGSYDNKEGQRVYTTDVVVENVEFAESKNSGANSEPAPQPSDGDGFMDIDSDIDDLPFN